MSGLESPAGPDELRELVREVLRDVLPTLAGATLAGATPRPEPVRLGTDEELHAFVLHLLRLADNPQRRRDILDGRLRFTLGPAAARAAPPASPPTSPPIAPPTSPPIIKRVDKGAVTERAVIAAAAAGARLVLGPRAMLTPLARDKARALGVHVEKER
jgi:hypothetical protein